MKQETIDGFSIPKRQLTQEEASRDVTFERISNFHHDAGEDYLDTCSLDKQAEKIFLGFLLAKHPELSKEILKVANGGYIDCEFYTLFEQEGDKQDSDTFYSLFAEFVNCTEGLKSRVNQVLIQVDEYYNQK
jgi:hypothetical protein